MHRLIVAASASAAVFLSGFASASLASESAPGYEPGARRCAAVSRDRFRTEEDLNAVVEGFGYRVVRVDTDDGCYLVRAADRRGRLFDIRFDGASLRMVSRYAAKDAAAAVAQR